MGKSDGGMLACSGGLPRVRGGGVAAGQEQRKGSPKGRVASLKRPRRESQHDMLCSDTTNGSREGNQKIRQKTL
jgi:hypothetical protein